MDTVNLTNIISKLTPAEREKLIIIRELKHRYGRAGYEAADRLGFSAKMIEAPGFDKQKFLQQVEKEVSDNEIQINPLI